MILRVLNREIKLNIKAAAVIGCLAGVLLAAFWFAHGRSLDFTGMERQRYPQDAAFAYCRQLEEQIGIQIFYLPEWTEAEDGLLHYENFESIEFDEAYFAAVRGELEQLRAACELYPEGFLRELVAKRAGRRVEIVLCPYTYAGYSQYGYYQQDFSEQEPRVDYLYLTGSGDPQFYSHELGHLVVTSGAELAGWREFCQAWDGCGEAGVTEYARVSRPEDWAETWAYLWHQLPELRQLCQDEVILGKVRLLTAMLAENYDSFAAGELPWRDLLD